MKAMILAAGLGTRLGVLTKSTPKPLIKVGDQAMLDLVVERLKLFGVDQIIINLHYFPDLIKEHVRLRNNYGLEIQFSYEPEILGTGGALKNVQHYFTGQSCFLVHNCDVYSEIDLAVLCGRHRENSNVATLAVLDKHESSYLLFDSRNLLLGWEVSSSGAKVEIRHEDRASRRVFTGIGVYSCEIFQFMQSKVGAFPIPETYLDLAKGGKRVEGVSVDSSYWIDMGSPEKLKQLEAHLASRAFTKNNGTK